MARVNDRLRVHARCLTGKAWGEMLEDYNLLHGRLWVLVLISVLLSPLVAAKLRGFVGGPAAGDVRPAHRL